MRKRIMIAGAHIALVAILTLSYAYYDYTKGETAAALWAAYGNRSSAWHIAMHQIEDDLTVTPGKIAVVEIDGGPQGRVAIGVFKDSGGNLFTRYTVGQNGVLVERYTDQLGKNLLRRTIFPSSASI